MTSNEFEAEYERLLRWRDLWMRLGQMREPGRLLSKQDRIERHFKVANNRIGALMRKFDHQCEKKSLTYAIAG